MSPWCKRSLESIFDTSRNGFHRLLSQTLKVSYINCVGCFERDATRFFYGSSAAERMELEYLVAALAGLLVLVYVWRSRQRKLPPGPWGLPIVGNLPFLTRKPHQELARLAKKYGNVFSLRMGGHYCVVINDFKNIKEAFSKDVFIARPDVFGFQVSETTRRTGALTGMPWKEQRRLCLHLLRDLGFGKSKMEGHIQEEIEELLSHFEKMAGEPFNTKDLLTSSMSNNVASLLFGQRFKYDDPFRKWLNHFINESVEAAGQTAWALFFPWLRKACEFLGVSAMTRLTRITNKAKDTFRRQIEEHEKTLNPDNVRDFIDGYLLEIKNRNEPAFHKDVLNDLVGAFFGGGSETVSTTLEWLILLVAHHQDHQRRLQAEVDDVIGRDRLPIWPDQKDTPFVNAYIMEMERWVSLLPLNLFRCPLEDTELDGYFIPKGTIILSNLWGVHHNRDYWGEDVNEFKPERFLSEDGKSIKKIDHYIPFSIGKRSCPGEPLAKIEIFMYFTAILQRFDVKLPEGKQANFEPVFGLSLRPVTQDVIMTRRH